MAIYGYKTNELSLEVLTEKLEKTRKSIWEIAEQNYYTLLGKEIALWADLSALNTVTLPEGVSIFDHSVRMLALKMLNAEKGDIFCAYNFRVFVHVVPYKGVTYLNVVCAQEELLNPFRRDFDSCIVPDGLQAELEQKLADENRNIWEEIEKEYREKSILGMDITPRFAPPQFSPDIEKAVFPPLSERCEIQARHHLLNSLLAKLSGNEAIEPCLLMPMIDDVYEMLTAKPNLAEKAVKKTQLTSILFDLKKNIPDLLGEKTVPSTN